MTAFELSADLCLTSTADLAPPVAAVRRQVVVGCCGMHGKTWHGAVSAKGAGRIGSRDPHQHEIRLLGVFAQLRGSAMNSCDQVAP
jgi:hypothetical protein